MKQLTIVELVAHVDSAASHLRDYAGSDAIIALVNWIDASVAAYKEELLEVTPEELAPLQAQTKQLQTLRSLAMGSVHTSGRI